MIDLKSIYALACNISRCCVGKSVRLLVYALQGTILVFEYESHLKCFSLTVTIIDHLMIRLQDEKPRMKNLQAINLILKLGTMGIKSSKQSTRESI